MRSAFDPVAADYDRDFSYTPLGRLLRERVWQNLLERLPPHAKVMEINAGTGEDALWMAARGCSVLATDASEQMVAVAKSKVARWAKEFPLCPVPEFRVCSFSQLADLQESGFDVVFSNFGGINCASPGELAELGAAIATKLKPGGQLVCVAMGRFCAWESFYFLTKGSWGEAFRRMRRGSVEANAGSGNRVHTWYYGPGELRRHLNLPGSRTPWLRPIGFWLPPSYLGRFFAKRPAMLRFLNFLEQKMSFPALAWASDHYLMELETTN
jgi:Methylase involved in ubiquinone/menaquinone biosynthesis